MSLDTLRKICDWQRAGSGGYRCREGIIKFSGVLIRNFLLIGKKLHVQHFETRVLVADRLKKLVHMHLLTRVDSSGYIASRSGTY